MRFYTEQECEEWLKDRERRKPDAVPDLHAERIWYPSDPHGLRFHAHWIATSLPYQMPALLWVTEWGIWGSSENWHLYYRLRQSYGDLRLLDEAPGHLFLEYEAEDFASFLQLAMLNGWGGYVLTTPNFVNAFFSHDGFINFFAEHESALIEVRNALAPREPAKERDVAAR